MSKYTINITDDDNKEWFVKQYMLHWINKNHPEIKAIAIEKYKHLIDEIEQNNTAVQQTVNT